MKLLISVAVFLLFVTVHGAEEVTNIGEGDIKRSSNQQAPAASPPDYHPKVKRAWNQLHGAGWGKRSENDIDDDPSVEELQQRLMRLYAEQLLANRASEDDTDFVNGDYDVDKRAKWSQLQNGWGKRDWNQLRGNELIRKHF